MRKIMFSMFKWGVKLFSGHGIGKFYPVKIVFYFLVSHLKNPNAVCDVQGNKMFVDSRDSLWLSVWGIYEPLGTELFKREIKSGEVVLDIGAHIGYYTLLASKLVGKNGRVYAFEPDPDNFALLEKNVKANDCKNVILVQNAVSNKTGKLKLYISEENTGDHRIYNSHDGRQSIEIESIRLDDYFKTYNEKIDFVKIDTQGAEGRVFQGMGELLKRNKNIKIYTEFWPIGLERCGIIPKEYLNLLIKHSFKLYHMNEEKKEIEPVHVSKLLETYTPEKGNHTNLYCVKRAVGQNLT